MERYKLSQTTDPSSLVARHACPHHRSPETNKVILLHCQRIVEAIGHRMVYDAAVSVGVSIDPIELYVASISLVLWVWP